MGYRVSLYFTKGRAADELVQQLRALTAIPEDGFRFWFQRIHALLRLPRVSLPMRCKNYLEKRGMETACIRHLCDVAFIASLAVCTFQLLTEFLILSLCLHL